MAKYHSTFEPYFSLPKLGKTNSSFSHASIVRQQIIKTFITMTSLWKSSDHSNDEHFTSIKHMQKIPSLFVFMYVLVMDWMSLFLYPLMRMLCSQHPRMRIFILTFALMRIFYFHDVEKLSSYYITDGTLSLQ